jgi:hypothetical protein
VMLLLLQPRCVPCKLVFGLVAGTLIATVGKGRLDRQNKPGYDLIVGVCTIAKSQLPVLYLPIRKTQRHSSVTLYGERLHCVNSSICVFKRWDSEIAHRTPGISISSNAFWPTTARAGITKSVVASANPFLTFA